MHQIQPYQRLSDILGAEPTPALLQERFSSRIERRSPFQFGDNIGVRYTISHWLGEYQTGWEIRDVSHTHRTVGGVDFEPVINVRDGKGQGIGALASVHGMKLIQRELGDEQYHATNLTPLLGEGAQHLQARGLLEGSHAEGHGAHSYHVPITMHIAKSEEFARSKGFNF